MENISKQFFVTLHAKFLPVLMVGLSLQISLFSTTALYPLVIPKLD